MGEVGTRCSEVGRGWGEVGRGGGQVEWAGWWGSSGGLQGLGEAWLAEQTLSWPEWGVVWSLMWGAKTPWLFPGEGPFGSLPSGVRGAGEDETASRLEGTRLFLVLSPLGLVINGLVIPCPFGPPLPPKVRLGPLAIWSGGVSQELGRAPPLPSAQHCWLLRWP